MPIPDAAMQCSSENPCFEIKKVSVLLRKVVVSPRVAVECCSCMVMVDMYGYMCDM
ncbi:hypothetical protein N9S31_00105 [bacterium]|nr:hypothetical protein [bacterium]